MDAQDHRCSHGNVVTLVVFKVLAYGRTYGQSRDNKIFQFDGFSNLLKYGALLKRLRRAGALLLEVKHNVNGRRRTAKITSGFAFFSSNP